MTQNAPKRIIWINLIKGSLLIFICCSHFEELPPHATLLVKPTATYWVPLFFFLSGYLFHSNNNFKKYIQRKSQTLLCPYIVFSFIFLIIDWNTYISPISQIETNLYRIFIAGIGPEKASPLWFIIVLYIASVFFPLINSIKRLYCKIIAIFLLSIVAYLMSEYDIKLPLMLHILPSTIIYMCIGQYVKTSLSSFRMNPFTYLAMVTLTFAIGLIGLFFINLGDFHLNKINSYPLFYLCPISLGIFLVLILNKYESNIATFNYLKPLTWVAQNGVIILATHCYLIFIYNTISNTLNINSIVINFILKFSFVFIILFTLIIPFCNRYLYWILGNKPKRWFNNYKQ
ncbi:acyltransferase family protein [Bacteroides fragilis]